MRRCSGQKAEQRELQHSQSYGNQRSSTATEMLLFLAMEIPFCASWSVEREVCLFLSHSIPGAVPLNSNLCEEKRTTIKQKTNKQKNILELV